MSTAKLYAAVDAAPVAASKDDLSFLQGFTAKRPSIEEYLALDKARRSGRIRVAARELVS